MVRSTTVMRRASALALPLALAAALLLLAALVLALAHHDAHDGAWSFALAELAALILPPAHEYLTFALLAAPAWLLLGLWPAAGALVALARTGASSAILLHGALPALGALLLARAIALAPAAAALAAPYLGPLALLALALTLTAALRTRTPADALLRLSAAPAALAAFGLLTITAEGLAGALLLTVGGGLATALATTLDAPHPETAPTPPSPSASPTPPSAASPAAPLPSPPLTAAPLPRPTKTTQRATDVAPRITHLRLLAALALLGVPGLAAAPGLLLVLLGALRHGTWTTPHAPSLAIAAALALTLTAVRLTATIARPTTPTAHEAPPRAPHTADPSRPRAVTIGLALVVVLVGLAPAPLLTRPGPAAAPWLRAVFARRCVAEAAPADRPRLFAAHPACTNPIIAVRERTHLQAATSPTLPPQPVAAPTAAPATEPERGPDPTPFLASPSAPDARAPHPPRLAPDAPSPNATTSDPPHPSAPHPSAHEAPP